MTLQVAHAFLLSIPPENIRKLNTADKIKTAYP